MAKVALLIGNSEYMYNLSPLPCATKDVEAMQRILQNSEIGGFDQVEQLINPDLQEIQVKIKTLFSGRKKEDLALLFFSGHGLKDRNGKFYFSNRATNSEHIEATATPASFVQYVMSGSRCSQVVILDCCFSGAFADGLTAKGEEIIDIQSQLSGKGRAVLTASTSTQYALEQQGEDLSVYTRFIVEGIETGAADIDNDGLISTDELHRYAQKKVQEVAPTMSPKIFTAEEGFRIYIAKAPINDPKLQYRKEVEKYATRGEISSTGHRILTALQEASGLTLEQAREIEAEVLKPYQEYKKKLRQYEQALVEALERRYLLNKDTYNELKSYQKILGLRDEDIAFIEKNFLLILPGINRFAKLSKKASLKYFSGACLLIGVGIAMATAIDTYKKNAIKPIEKLIAEKKYEECITKMNQDLLLRATEFKTVQQCYQGVIAQAKEIFLVNNDFEQAMRLLDLVPQGVIVSEVAEVREVIFDLKHYRDAKEAESKCDWLAMKKNLENIKNRSPEMQNSLEELIRKLNTGEALIQMKKCPNDAIIPS